MVISDEIGVVILLSVVRVIFGKKDFDELIKSDGDKFIGKKIILVYVGRNSDIKNMVKIEIIIFGIINLFKEGFVRGFDVFIKIMNDFIKIIGIEKLILFVDVFIKMIVEVEEIVEKYEDDKDWVNYLIINVNVFVDIFS